MLAPSSLTRESIALRIGMAANGHFMKRIPQNGWRVSYRNRACAPCAFAPGRWRIILCHSGFGSSIDSWTFGAFIIGDELLSGKRQDKHLPKLITAGRAWVEAGWAQYLGDNPARLLALRPQPGQRRSGVQLGGAWRHAGRPPRALRRRRAGCAAGHPRKAGLEDALATKPTHRINMVRTSPEGSRLIPNPVNQMPGFSVHDHHFVPGFPSMACPMVDGCWTRNRHQFAPGADIELTVMAEHARERWIDLTTWCELQPPAFQPAQAPTLCRPRAYRQVSGATAGKVTAQVRQR